MTFDSSQPAFEKLRLQILNDYRPVVPFIGAGLSSHGSPDQRLPLWGGLVKSLTEHAGALGVLTDEDEAKLAEQLESGALIAAIDILVNRIGEKQFRLYVEHTFCITGRPIPPAIAQLVCIGWSLIVTTNLDRFIEEAWHSQYGSPIEVVTRSDPTKLAQALAGIESNEILAKIHGTLERYESWVLSSSHYEYIVSKPEYLFALQSLFLRTIFFVGYGISDEDLDLLFIHIRTIFPAGVGRYFALLSDNQKGSPRVNNLIRDYGIEPIWYRAYPGEANEPHAGHREVEECIQLLVEAWTSKTHETEITLKYFPELEPTFTGRLAEIEKIDREISSASSAGLQIIGFGGEGKTSLVQKYVQLRRGSLSRQFSQVFGVSFYGADVSRFVNDAYTRLLPRHEPLLSIGSKVSALAKHIESVPVLLIFDGIEGLVSDEGELTNEHLRQLLDSAIIGRSKVLVTSRRTIRTKLPALDLEGLNEKDARKMLSSWLPSAENIEEFLRSTGTHALSIRLAASHWMQNNDEVKAAVKVINLKDESKDRATANKARRILERYYSELDDNERKCIGAFSVFRRPLPTTWFLSFLGELNHDSQDPRIVIWNLVERRLLIVEDGSNLTCHPLVKEFFSERLSKSRMREFHRSAAKLFSRHANQTLPDNLSEALLHIEHCYHSGQCGNLATYFNILHGTLNRTHLNYLGTVIGAWDEYLQLSKLADENLGLSSERRIYLLASSGRSLKHLGRCREALPKYLRCVENCIECSSVNTARYSNNLLDLCLLLDHRRSCVPLIELNSASLRDIEDNWVRCWQTEHCYYSFAHYFAIVGRSSLALELYQHGDHSWEREGIERQRFFDTTRLHWSDLLLTEHAFDPDQAVLVAEENLSYAEEMGWDEVACKAKRALCSALRADALVNKNETSKERSLELLESSLSMAAVVNLPAAWIEVLLEKLRCRLSFQIDQISESDLLDVQTVLKFIQRSGIALHQTEARAAQINVSIALGKGSKGSEFGAAQSEWHNANYLSYGSDFSHIGMLVKQVPVSGFPEPEIADFAPDFDLPTIDPRALFEKVVSELPA